MIRNTSFKEERKKEKNKQIDQMEERTFKGMRK